MSDPSNVTPRYLGSEQKGAGFVVVVDFLRWKTADTVFAVLSISFQVWT